MRNAPHEWHRAPGLSVIPRKLIMSPDILTIR